MRTAGRHSLQAPYTATILYSAGTSSLWLVKTKCPIIDDYLWEFCDKVNSEDKRKKCWQLGGLLGVTWTIMIWKWFIGSWLAAVAGVLQVISSYSSLVGWLWSENPQPKRFVMFLDTLQHCPHASSPFELLSFKFKSRSSSLLPGIHKFILAR